MVTRSSASSGKLKGGLAQTGGGGDALVRGRAGAAAPVHLREETGEAVSTRHTTPPSAPVPEVDHHLRRSITFLNTQGDGSIAWDKESDDVMRPIIEKMMKEGVRFFIVKPRLVRWLPPKMTRLEKFTDLKDSERSLWFFDDEVGNALATGHAREIERPAGEIEVTKTAETADEAVKSQTVAVKPTKGG